MIKDTDSSQCQTARSKAGNLATPRSQKNDTQKLKGIDDDLGMVNASIALMKKAKDEAKLKLDQKFIDINKQLVTTKDFVQSETKRINESLSTTQTKLAVDIEKISSTSVEQYTQVMVLLEKKFQGVNQKCNELEKTVNKEREERTKQIEQTVTPLIQRIEKLEAALEFEKDLRQQKEKELARNFAVENQKVLEKVDAQKLQNEAKLKEINSAFKIEAKQQQKLAEELNSQIKSQLDETAHSIERDMENRFKDQDKIVDNLNQMVKTFQATLKALTDDS